MNELVSLRWLTRRRLCSALVVFAIFGASALVAYIRPDFQGLAVYGYPGLFVLMFASSASVLLPLPGFATVIAGGAMGNPLLIALVAGPGSALGELTGYVAGCGGRALIQEQRLGTIRRFENWLRRYGFWALFALAAIPNPAFDLVGLAAGSLGFPVKRFLAAVLLGNTVKYLFLAYVGNRAVGIFFGG